MPLHVGPHRGVCYDLRLRILQTGKKIVARPTDARQDLADLDLAALEVLFHQQSLPRFRARQVFAWIHQHGVTDFAAMTNLGRDLRSRLADRFRVSVPRLAHEDRSTDGTRKFLFELEDGRRIEAVYIPDTPRQTFCISSQVGCAMDCGFCLTGKMGFARHLAPAEIAGQVRVLAEATGLAGTPFNIVLMFPGPVSKHEDFHG